MNILLTSVGRRSYLVEYFKEAVGASGKIHASNSSSINPSFIFADQYIVTPLIHESEYIPFLLNYCVENDINAIISLFDIDLPILSANRLLFDQNGIRLLVSNERVINICNDKWVTHEFLRDNHFSSPKTYLSLDTVVEALDSEEVGFPVFVKPRWGMGSIGIFEANNRRELEIIHQMVKTRILNSYLKYGSETNMKQNIIFQEKLIGQEFGLDVINDLDGVYQNTIVKKKHAMRWGETDCAETVDNPKMVSLGQRISCKLKHIANLDVDAIFADGELFIIEMNARFGGGYPFSHLAGVDLPLAIVKWLRNEKVDHSLLEGRAGVLGHKNIGIQDISRLLSRMEAVDGVRF